MTERYGCQGCCSFPNGRMAVIGMLFALVSYGMTSSAVWGCRYVLLEDVDVGFGRVNGKIGLGLYSVEDVFDDRECRVWSDFGNEFIVDATWNAARAMGTIAGFCGLFCLVATICSACMGLRVCFLKILAAFAASAGVCVILTEIVFASNVCNQDIFGSGCTFDVHAGIAIGASILWFFTTFILMKVPPPAEIEDEYPRPSSAPTMATAVAGSVAPPPGTVTTTETDLPDGTKKITRTTYNSDGSKTVEETIETPNMAIPTASAKTY